MEITITFTVPAKKVINLFLNQDAFFVYLDLSQDTFLFSFSENKASIKVCLYIKSSDSKVSGHGIFF